MRLSGLGEEEEEEEAARQKGEEVREDERKPRRTSGQMESIGGGEKMKGDRWRRKEERVNMEMAKVDCIFHCFFFLVSEGSFLVSEGIVHFWGEIHLVAFFPRER